MSPPDKRFLVDGQLLNEKEVRDAFNHGVVDLGRLEPRERVALTMVGRAGPKGRLLDVGCYGGSFLAAVRQQYPDLEAQGVDYFEDNIAIARLLYPEFAECYQQMSVYELDFPDESFDCVTFKEVIEHICRPVDALREINRVLRTGGHLVLTTPNANAQAWRLFFSGIRRLGKRLRGQKTEPGHQIFFENVEWNRHIFAWTSATLNTLMMVNGFKYVAHQFYCNSRLQQLFPEMGDGLAFLMRKSGPPPNDMV